MLTLILLVVLCGGLGLLAVTMAEAKPATNDDDDRRGRPLEQAPAPDPPAPVRVAEPAVPVPRNPTRAPEPTQASRPVGAGATSPLQRRRHRGSIPAAHTALEGAYGDLVRPPFARRLTSLSIITLIVVLVGVGIAVVLGAVVGGAAEVFGNTIG